MDSLQRSDAIFGSLSGAVLDMGAYWWSDKTLASVFKDSSKLKDLAQPGMDKAQSDYMRKSHPFRARLSKHFSFIDGLDAKSITHGQEVGGRAYARQAWREARGYQGFFRSGDWIENRMSSQLGVSKEVAGKMHNALRFRNLTLGITGVWMASMGASIASSTVNTLRQRGAEEIGKRYGFNSENFVDSQTAYTTRQRALRAIQNSQSGYRRALGNEASFLHTYR